MLLWLDIFKAQDHPLELVSFLVCFFFLCVVGIQSHLNQDGRSGFISHPSLMLGYTITKRSYWSSHYVCLDLLSFPMLLTFESVKDLWSWQINISLIYLPLVSLAIFFRGQMLETFLLLCYIHLAALLLRLHSASIALAKIEPFQMITVKSPSGDTVALCLYCAPFGAFHVHEKVAQAGWEERRVVVSVATWSEVATNPVTN